MDMFEKRLDDMGIMVREQKAEHLRMAEMLPAVVGPGLLPGDYVVEGSWTKDNMEDYASTWGIPGGGAINGGSSWVIARDLIKVDQMITDVDRKVDAIDARAGAQSAV